MIWSEQYKKLQQQYFMCVETMDPDSIAELLQFHPYHLDSLLQLADVCKQSSEHETAIGTYSPPPFPLNYWLTKSSNHKRSCRKSRITV